MYFRSLVGEYNRKEKTCGGGQTAVSTQVGCCRTVISLNPLSLSGESDVGGVSAQAPPTPLMSRTGLSPGPAHPTTELQVRLVSCPQEPW